MQNCLQQLFEHSSLRFRLQSLIIFACLPALCVSVYSGLENRQIEVARVQQDVVNLVSLAARDQEELINLNTPPLLKLLATLYPEVQDRDGTRASALFARVLSGYPQYINIMAAKVPGGEVFASGIAHSAPLNLGDRPYFASAVETGKYTIGEYVLGKATGKPTLVCSYPVLNRRGEATAVIMAGIDLEGLGRYVAESGLNKDAVITLLDRNGRVLFTTSNHKAWVGKDISGSPLWQSIIRSGNKGIYQGTGFAGEHYLMAFRGLAGATGKGDGYVVAGIPQRVAYAAADASMRRNLLGIIISTLLALIGTMLIAHRSILGKVRLLISAAQVVGEGKLGAQTGLTHNRDEFGQLARTFDLMSQKLLEREQARKQAENLLSDEKERLMVTLRSIGDGVITTDSAGSVTLLNGMAEKLTGWTLEEAAGKSLTDIFRIINEDTRKTCINPVEKVLRTGLIVELENHTVLIARDGTERIIADSGAPIVDSQNAIIGVVLVFRDITEKQRMENELIKMEKLESLGLLAGGIAHDFNNILTAILGNIALARLADPKGEANDMLREAEFASLRARDLTRQLMTFAKGGEPVCKTVAIADLVSESARFVLSGSPVRCSFDLSRELWPVDVDEGQFTQVIHNLVINAKQAMPEGGTISITGGNCIIPRGSSVPLKEGNYVKITIEDEGYGIAEEHLEKIFDPYFTTKDNGQGLGLASSFHIIKRHDGYLTADSREGAGATFSIYLPASRSRVRENKTETIPFSGTGKILVMDDEEIVRQVVGEMLVRLGYKVEFAVNGGEAIEKYRVAFEAGDPFAAVIMDLTIPGGMGGKEAVTRLLEMDPDARALASSGYSDDSLMAEYRQHGFCGVIPKPYVLDELKQALKEALEGA